MFSFLCYNDQIFIHTYTKTMVLHYAKFRIYPVAILMTSVIGSLFSPVYAEERPYQQDFVVTAYYSPLPNQCCYFRGSYEEDIAFNGRGETGADGTGVYPGMIAAPASYDFGTRIDLEGLGVGTVHDRGGRIIEWSDDLHRIDLWMGTGEEGLARALAWGARRVSGTVYPFGTPEMPRESLSLKNLPAQTALLGTLAKTDTYALLKLAAFGDTGFAVRFLQLTLKNLGYFPDAPSGSFGPATQKALQEFLADAGLKGDGTSVDDHAAAAMKAAVGIKDENLPDLALGLRRGNRGSDVRQAQKLLRFLGFYRGRTDGIFNAHLRESVIAFQLKSGVVGNASDAGVGTIGPATQTAILHAWKMKIVAMKTEGIVTKMRIASSVRFDALLPSKVLASGDHGRDVRVLQTFLRDRGYLASKDTTGTFGERTKTALLRYQMDAKIVASAETHGAGVFGPATKAAAMRDIVAEKWNSVRANGTASL